MPLKRSITTGLSWMALLSLLALAAYSVALPLPVELTRNPTGRSLRVEAQDGSLLREVRGADGELSPWARLEQIPKLVLDAVVVVEDRHFYYHPGVDPFAMLRATWQVINNGRIVSGASTLSMQLARTLRPRPRNLWGKFCEMALALRIEQQLTKREILEQYLNRVDFGPNLRGVAAVARGYYDKPLAALSLGEIALIAGLPQSPSGYVPHRHLKRALQRRAYVLERLQNAGIVTGVMAAQARTETVDLAKRRPSFGAPHFVTALVTGALGAIQPTLSTSALKNVTRLRTTLDPLLQRQAESAVSTVLAGLTEKQVTAAALLAVDNVTGDVLAYVGSPDFYDVTHLGQVDGVRARRQPGSTLKPFVYGAAFEQLGYTAATVLPDLELTFDTETGPYRPRNFDDKFRGPVRLREALGNSLNVPAVHTAVRLGAKALLAYLRQLGFTSLNRTPEFYGPALALGDGEVTLLELVHAYHTLARGGTQIPLRFVSEMVVRESGSNGITERVSRVEPGSENRVLPRAVAAILTDILKDPAARLASFGTHSPLEFDFDVAAKTGTSKGFRDNWVVGYTEQLTVGVWVGNFDGLPMRQVSGIAGAAPIFHALLAASAGHKRARGLPLSKWDENAELRNHYDLQRVEICPLSGQARGAHCAHGIVEHVPLEVVLPTCDWHRELALDRRNGLLAGPDCNARDVVRRQFELLPEEYATWATSTNRAPPPEQFSPNCPAPILTDTSRSLRIDVPADGSRFVLDPEASSSVQQLKFEAIAPASIATLTLLANDREVGKSRRPFEFFWQLETGVFRFVVVTEQGERSVPVVIEVRGEP